MEMERMNKSQAARSIIAAADDDGGTIQATEMLALSQRGAIPNDPRLHTTMSVERALAAAGLSAAEIEAALDQ
jgi:hypothetical protein